ncbi:MAG TPA: hypothetical protein VIL86_00780 [Tepidisphaeraceae bacterium]|jgi:hypothetical protein
MEVREKQFAADVDREEQSQHLFCKEVRMSGVSKLFAAMVLGAAGMSLSGCTTEKYDEMPSAAMQQVTSDDRMTWRAPEDGRVWVVNRDRDKIVYSGRLLKGQEIVVDPDKNRVRIDGRSVMEDIKMDRHDTRKIYFLPDDRTTERRVIEERDTRIERRDRDRD